MAQKKKIWEAVIHGMFLILGLITVGCVLLITVYLVISGIPAIRKIGLGAVSYTHLRTEPSVTASTLFLMFSG